MLRLGITRVKKDQTPTCHVVQDHRVMGINAALYLTPAPTRSRAIHSKKLRQFPARTDTFKVSFVPRTIPVWNTLSQRPLIWYTSKDCLLSHFSMAEASL